MSNATLARRLPRPLYVFVCTLMAALVVQGSMPFVPMAIAADSTKPDSVTLEIAGDSKKIDVAKEVATLNSSEPNKQLTFTVADSYASRSASDRQRELVLEDSSGKQSESVATTGDNTFKITVGKLKADRRLVLKTSVKDGGSMKERYKSQLNVRLVNAAASEKSPSSGEPGGFSFSNGLSYTFKNTGFKFLDNTTMSLNGLDLPLMYKHNPDGTTTVGINCSPDEVAFLKAVKNGNAWQKFTTEAGAKMTSKADKGWSGKEFGKWGGKSFDWQIMGYMEYNTKNPDSPRAINLIVSLGVSASGGAQYLCFTGNITFKAGGKAMITGKWSKASGFEGTFGLGAYANLELYIGLGLNYVASVGAYGKGGINIDFQLLPKSYLKSIDLTGELGAKAKVFGFTVYTWKILSGKKNLYNRMTDPKALSKQSDSEFLVDGGYEDTPLTVSAETAYPMDSRAYLDIAPQVLDVQDEADSSELFKNVYGQTELAGTTTDKGPVVACVVDADQVNKTDARADADRSAVAYTRKVNGIWSEPKVIDNTDTHGAYADYSPDITSDGENIYITYLAADSANMDTPEGGDPNLGSVGKKLDVKVATIKPDDSVIIETLSNESDVEGTMPSNPRVFVDGDDLYVGYYTNEASGNKSQVIGLSGNHVIKVFRRATNGEVWEPAHSDIATTGALTSFAIGMMGDEPTFAWSGDPTFDPNANSTGEEGVTLNGVDTLKGSKVSAVNLNDPSAVPDVVGENATNAQFVTYGGEDVLAFATLSDDEVDTGSGISIECTTGDDSNIEILNGAKVDLPTTTYTLTGDMGVERGGNISFLRVGGTSSDISALVTKGKGSSDWSDIEGSTFDDDVVTDYCCVYDDGDPLFIYTTEPPSSEGISTQDDSSEGATINQATKDDLKHLCIDDVDFDEFEVQSGQEMPVTAYVSNDGMYPVDRMDLYKLEGDDLTKVASSDESIGLDGETAMDFSYQIPPASEFSGAKEFVLYAAPAGHKVTADEVNRALSEGIAFKVSYGAPSLALDVQQTLVDGQETLTSSIVNDGITPHGANLVYLDANTGDELRSVEVPELGEHQSFTDTYDAPSGLFLNDGVSDIVITLQNDGSENDTYELNNTDFVSAWDLGGEQQPEAAQETSPDTTTLPETGDPALAAGLLALAGATTAVAGSLRSRRRAHSNRRDRVAK